MNDSMNQYYNTNALGLSEANRQAQMQQDALRAQNYNSQQSLKAGVAGQNAQTRGQLLGGVFSAAGSLGAAGIMANALPLAAVSDERAKTNIDRKATQKDLGEFLDKLDAASYDYKDTTHGQGRHYGIMAQSAAKSKVGKTMVMELPGGTMALDIKKTLGAVLASSKTLHDRIKTLEARKR